MSNPFNTALDWALQGKYARVQSGDAEYKGWVDRVHHNRGSLVMHDCVNATTDEEVGSVFIRTADVVVTLYPKKRIEYRDVAELEPYPDYNFNFEPKADVMRRCYRNKFAGGFPVVRENGTILNGHKRIEACRTVGLDKHPVEVVDVTDEQAAELFRLAHRKQVEADEETESDDQ